MSEEHEKDSREENVWQKVQAFAVILALSVTAYKLAVTPFNVIVDFPTLLSLLLAFFSVGLAALFYFKATETSNAFYDNTYKFTRELAQLLTKIESGFGEKLRSLDESYTAMREQIHRMPTDSPPSDSAESVEEEKEEVKGVKAERDALVSELIEKSQLRSDEKESFSRELANKNNQLDKAQSELARLKRRAVVERVTRPSSELGLERLLRRYTKKEYAERLSRSSRPLSDAGIRRRFSALLSNAEESYVRDMTRLGYLDDEKRLTPEGLNLLRELVSEVTSG